ncbi:TniQ family protein [Thalassotalea piscium]|uniref:TniQ domain-containing protein n=1 Tax=Thalassotalea piscium TaxID=1230533 RepID=A0A7X0TT58_9GAMM|nr:TniQ family protein [Thalassotalea piscium]MBB6542897.1 hypothetical protein [Thalassotalea piscium]
MFLFTPKSKAYDDEALESYLIRIVNENFFDSYQQLSRAIKDELRELDFEAYGAFPLDLKLLNIYHAKQDSHFRMRAFELLESLLNLPKFELQKLAIFRSYKKINSQSTVNWKGIDFPLSFVRYEGASPYSIPICPECLRDEPYIRQVWHFKHYQACDKHNHNLVEKCPSCNLCINYIANESITHCSCGFELTNTKPFKAPEFKALLSSSMRGKTLDSSNPILNDTPLYQKLSAIAWFQKRYFELDSFDNESIINYFEKWPKNFYQELDEIAKDAELKLIDTFNKTSFTFIFGNLIFSSNLLSEGRSRGHFVWTTVENYLLDLVSKNPKSQKTNIADSLINIAEASAILSTSYEQVYRLYESGTLKAAFRPKIKQKLTTNEGVFFLRQVVELKKSFGDHYSGVYLSKW